MDQPSWRRAPVLPVPRHPCGSRQAWSPPSPGPRPLGRSPARLQDANDCRNRVCVRAAAGPDRYAVDLNFDRPGIRLGLASRRFAPPTKCRRRRDQSATAGTNRNSSVSECWAAVSLSCRRQPNNCCGDNPWRRATAQTESLLVSISATIRALSSSLHFRRRPAPVKTSSRRTGSVIALCTVSILSLTVKTKPKTRRSAHHPKGGRRTSLTEDQHYLPPQFALVFSSQ